MLKRSGCALLFTVILSGCSMTSLQKEQLARFGKATEVMGEFAEKELLQIRRGIIEMNTAMLILDAESKVAGIDLDSPTSAESAAKRLAAVKALRCYGSILNELATADRTASIKEKAQELVDSFDSALEQGLSKEQKEAATGIITSLGSMWVEKKKRDSVEAIVLSYQGSVETLADLLAVDFAPLGTGYVGAYTAVAGKLKNRAVGVLSSGQHSASADRECAVSAFVMATGATNRAAKLGAAAESAIASLKKANKELAEVMTQDTYAAQELKAYAKHIRDLISMAEVLADE